MSKKPVYMTHAEADAALRKLVMEVMNNEPYLIGRSLAVRGIRRMLGLDNVGPEANDRPVVQGGVGLVGVFVTSSAIIVALHNEDPIDGFPRDYGLVINSCQLEYRDLSNPTNWPEYKAGGR